MQLGQGRLTLSPAAAMAGDGEDVETGPSAMPGDGTIKGEMGFAVGLLECNGARRKNGRRWTQEGRETPDTEKMGDDRK